MIPFSLIDFHLKWFLFQINKVRDAVEQCDSKDLKKEFENIEKALKDRGLIDAQVQLTLMLLIMYIALNI